MECSLTTTKAAIQPSGFAPRISLLDLAGPRRLVVGRHHGVIRPRFLRAGLSELCSWTSIYLSIIYQPGYETSLQQNINRCWSARCNKRKRNTQFQTEAILRNQVNYSPVSQSSTRRPAVLPLGRATTEAHLTTNHIPVLRTTHYLTYLPNLHTMCIQLIPRS